MFNPTHEVPVTTLLIVYDFMECRHFQGYGWFEKEFELLLLSWHSTCCLLILSSIICSIDIGVEFVWAPSWRLQMRRKNRWLPDNGASRVKRIMLMMRVLQFAFLFSNCRRSNLVFFSKLFVWSCSYKCHWLNKFYHNILFDLQEMKNGKESENPGQIQLHLLVVPRGNTGILGEMPVANGALDDNQYINWGTSMCGHR